MVSLALTNPACAETNKDNKNGTIADDAHGIVWLKNATCLGWSGWWSAGTSVARLQSGMCGLSDKSTAGQWRLPTPQAHLLQ
jgi:hypothetical protein